MSSNNPRPVNMIQLYLYDAALDISHVYIYHSSSKKSTQCFRLLCRSRRLVSDGLQDRNRKKDIARSLPVERPHGETVVYRQVSTSLCLEYMKFRLCLAVCKYPYK